ncbi:MAG: peptidase [Chloroflexi bacterium]|nr:peptidase [Chloroflexota bacterium]
MRVLTLFLDGIGLGADDPESNPFALADTPFMRGLANGKRWLATTGPQESAEAVFIPTDARLGVPGRPQSGTGQASLLTGVNAPRLIGRHYGPKPEAKTRALIAEHSYFKRLELRGKSARLLTAYPPRLLADFARGKTLRSSVQQAAYESGLPHFTLDDVIARRALTAEWTTDSWRAHLGFESLPRYSPREAGKLMAKLSRGYDFAFHSHWLTDRIGHRGTLERGLRILERFDAVLGGLLAEWQADEGLVVITSDHGNMEDLSGRRHTLNEVPTVVLGARAAEFARDYRSLTDFVPACDRMLFESG